MGVMWHAAFQTKDARGALNGQPSPVDGDPTIPWPTALWLKYMPRFTQAGGTVLVLPPVTKGASLGTGYDPYNHFDLGSNPHGPAGRRETRYGSVEEIMRTVARCRALGMQVYANVVHHHLDGDRGDYRYDYVAGDGKTPGRYPFDRTCFEDDPSKRPAADRVFNPATDWSFGREFLWNTGTYGDGRGENGPGYVRRALADALDRQTRRLGIEGYFPDDGKGTNTDFFAWLYRQGAMADKFAFSEVSDGTTGNLLDFMARTGNRLGVMDFALRYKIRDVCNWQHDFREILREGVIWHDPTAAVTFVEDIDLDISDPILWRKRLAYALILGLPGYPMVFGKDFYAPADGGYGMSLDVLDNLIWCHEVLAQGDTWVRAAGSDYLVIERMAGGLFGFTTRNAWVHVPNVQTRWKNAQLHDYQGQSSLDKWTDGAGFLDLWIPPDGDGGAGRGHCCFAPVGIERAVRFAPRRTTQVFIGGADLDLPAIRTLGATSVGWLEIAGGTAVSAALDAPFDGTVMLLDAHGAPVSLSRVPADGRYTVAINVGDATALGRGFVITVTYAAPRS